MSVTYPPTWSGMIGQPQVVTYSFDSGSRPIGNITMWNAPRALSDVDKAAFRQALDTWSGLSGVDFLEIPNFFSIAAFPFDVQLDLQVAGLQFDFHERTADGGGRIGERAGIVLRGTAPTLADMVLAVGSAIGVPAPPTTLTFGDGRWTVVEVLPDLEAAQLLYGTAAEKAANGVTWRWDADSSRVQGLGDEGANRLSGTSSADELIGGAGDDILLGRGGADLLRPGRGDDTLDGGAGQDLAVFEALRGESTLDIGGGTVSSAFGGVDTFSGIEVLRFADGRLTLDAPALSNEAVTIGLYRVLLDLAPDPGGLAYWVMRMDAVGAQNVAAGIIAHQAYQDRVAAGLARADLAPWTAVELAERVAVALPAGLEAGGVWVPDAETMTLARMHHLAFHSAPVAADLRADVAALKSGASLALIGQGLLDRQLGTDAYPDGASLAEAAQDWSMVARFWNVAGAQLALRPEGGGMTGGAIITWVVPTTAPVILTPAPGPTSTGIHASAELLGGTAAEPLATGLGPADATYAGDVTTAPAPLADWVL